MPRRERTGERRATLYARGDLPGPATDRRNTVAHELADIAASGSLDVFDVVHWAKRVPAEGQPAQERSLAAEFRTWADEEGVQLAPCFDTRRCYGQQTGEKREELVMPVLCLAVYEGEALVEVAPHAEDGEIVTVADCLARLSADSTRERGEEVVVTTAD